MRTISPLLILFLCAVLSWSNAAKANKSLVFDTANLKTKQSQTNESTTVSNATTASDNSSKSNNEEEVNTISDNNASDTAYVFFNNDASFKSIYAVSKSAIIGDLDLKGTLEASKTIEGSKLVANEVTCETLVVEQIISNGNFQMNGNVVLTGSGIEADGDVDELSSEGTQSFILKSKRTWKMFSHDDFEDEGHGWSFLERQKCAKGYPNYFLGGHCVLSADQVTKKFTNLPAHTEIRIAATYHAFDNWQGESAYMRVNNQTMWERRIEAKSFGADRCGNSDFSDDFMNIKIEKIIPHTEDSLELSFGSTLNKNPCDASFGIDDLEMYTR